MDSEFYCAVSATEVAVVVAVEVVALRNRSFQRALRLLTAMNSKPAKLTSIGGDTLNRLAESRRYFALRGRFEN